MSRAHAVAGVALLVTALTIWFIANGDGEGGDVRRRLEALAADVNQSPTDGGSPEARAARLASYFTEDVIVDLGRGSAPIEGRATLLGIAERLQPRTAAFRLRFEDITVAMAAGGSSADVHLTAEIMRRSITTGEESLDAREFTMTLQRAGETWQISRVTAIDTLK
jgi:hypothetical protein